MLAPGNLLELRTHETGGVEYATKWKDCRDSDAFRSLPEQSPVDSHTGTSEACDFIGTGWSAPMLSYVLELRPQPGLYAEEVCRRIEAQTGYVARQTGSIRWDLHSLLLEETRAYR